VLVAIRLIISEQTHPVYPVWIYCCKWPSCDF